MTIASTLTNLLDLKPHRVAGIDQAAPSPSTTNPAAMCRTNPSKFDAAAQVEIGKARKCVEAAERLRDEAARALVLADDQLSRASTEIDRSRAPDSLEARMKGELDALRGRLSNVRRNRVAR